MTHFEQNTDRLNIRLRPDEKHLLEEAAAAANQKLSAFVLDSCRTAAQAVLADRTRFILDDKDWDKFVQLLDRPDTQKPRLSKLLNEPTVLER